MANGKHCPNCERDIGIWPIFTAGLPNRIRCPGCKTRLVYAGTGALVAAALLLAIAVSAGGLYLVQKAGLTGENLAFAFAAVLLVVWVPVEVAIAVWLRSRFVLIRAQPA